MHEPHVKALVLVEHHHDEADLEVQYAETACTVVRLVSVVGSVVGPIMRSPSSPAQTFNEKRY